MRINRKRARWGRILLVPLVALGVVMGLLGSKLIRAWEGSYWTTTSGDGLSITVVSVEQNGVSLAPQEDGEGGYYFNVANSTDTVRVGARIEGMVQDETYYYYASNDYWTGRQELTHENNGQVIYEEVELRIYFQDEDSCHGECYVDPMSGLYHVTASIYREHGYGVGKELVVRPASMGSGNIDILSVRQNGADLPLTNNEFQIDDYSSPLSITLKLRGLTVDRAYYVNFNNVDAINFVADADEKTVTYELNYDLVSRHFSVSVDLSGSDVYDSSRLYFKVVDGDYKQLGDIVIDEIRQGSEALTPVLDESSGQRREYNFTANDAQGLTAILHTTRATAGLNYYITYRLSGHGSGDLVSDEAIVVTGEELEQHGVALPISAALGMSDYSPFTLAISVSTLESESLHYNSQDLVYQNYGEYSSSDELMITFHEDENIPRFDATMYYHGGISIDSADISPLYHDASHPLLVEVNGEHYDDEQTYDVVAKVKVEQETYYNHTFTATGAELNEGTVFELEGLTLTLPVFDPDNISSVSERVYDFSLEIDGLRLSGGMYYAYSGWLSSLLTFNNGEVATISMGGGIGGTIYVNGGGTTARKSTFAASKGAKLHFMGRDFENDLTYSYELYHIDDTGGVGWSTSSGSLINTGSLTGAELNGEGLVINMLTPGEQSGGELYTLVIKLNGGLVRITQFSLLFTEEPRVETFKFGADSDSFMQTAWAAYRVATGTDIRATLYGDGFEDETEYKLWISYNGYRYSEEVDESGYPYTNYVDLTSLDTSVTMTGAALNAGYEYIIEYVEALANVNYIDVEFAVSDVDAERPTWVGETGNGYYAGHDIHVDYVNNEEVFRDEGFQVNDDGSITDVSQPDQPGGIPINNRAVGEVEMHVENGDTLVLVTDKPTLILGHKNGQYELVEVSTSIDDDGTKTNTYGIGEYDEVVVALKGNLKDNDTEIDLLDANVIYRSLLNPSSPAYRELTPVEMILADLNGDHSVDLLDANVIYRSLLSHSSPAYQAITW